MLSPRNSQRTTAYGPGHRLAFLGIILLAFALRVNCLACQSFWLDEATSALRTTFSTLELLLDTADNLHTPGYYLLLKGWATLVGLDEFSLRYFSVLSGVLLVPVLYRAATTLWRKRQVGLLAALLVTLNPAHVYYAQETRMYALTPVLYALMLLLALAADSRRGRRLWVILALVEVAALYVHPFALLQLLVLNAFLLLVYWQRRQSTFLRRWLLSQSTVALAFVPWLLLVWQRGGAIPANLSNAAATETTRSLGSYLHLVWRFLLSGLIESTSWSAILAGAAVAFLAITLPFALYNAKRRRSLLALLFAFVFPLLLAYTAWWFNPLNHPRYLLFLLAPLLLLIARILALLLRRHALLLLGLVGLILFAGGDALALDALLTEGAFARYNVRRLARELAERSQPGEVVLMPPNDPSLWYYDPRPATATNWPLATGHQGERTRQLREILQDRDAVYLVQYEDLYTYDPHEQLPFLLELNGRLSERFTVDRMDVARYGLEDTWQAPTFEPRVLSCGPLTLTGAFYQPLTRPAQAVVVALRWQLQQTVPGNVVVSARLWDGQQRLAGHDTRLLNERGAPASGWPVGQQGVTYHVLPVPLGTPPLAYNLTALVLDETGRPLPCEDGGGQGLALGAVQVYPSTVQTTDPYGSWQDTPWQTPQESEIAPGLILEGYAVRPATLKPASTAFVTLRWRAARDLQQTVTPELLLQSEGEILARASGDLFDRYPTDRWSQGELLIETRQLAVPPTLDPMQLTLRMADTESALGAIGIDRDALTWELPPQATPTCAVLGAVAELAGFRWAPREGGSGGTLTLYWRALPGARSAPSYTVFTHLLAPDGQLAGQHDGLPAGGQRPTTSWLPGEIIADEHALTLEDNATGPLRLTAGMYDLATSERLTANTCEGQRIPHDAIPITVIEP